MQEGTILPKPRHRHSIILLRPLIPSHILMMIIVIDSLVVIEFIHAVVAVVAFVRLEHKFDTQVKTFRQTILMLEF